jgi:hypothetical protein
MHQLLESLVPDTRPVYWKWVGGVFALYVVLLLAAASVFVGHESPGKLTLKPAATVAIDGKPHPVPEASAPLRQAARY